MGIDIFWRTIRRLGSVDGLIIILCDVALLIPALITWWFSTIYASKLTTLLGSIVLSPNMMVQNPSVANLNLALFRQASLYTGTWLAICALIWAISLGVLNTVQWHRVSNHRLSQYTFLRYTLIEAIWHLIGFIALFVITFVILDPARIPVGVPTLLILLSHLTLGIHIGILHAKNDMTLKSTLPGLVRPAFRQGWRWLISYALLVAISILALIATVLLSFIGLPVFVGLVLMMLIALAWWRMISWEILSGHVKKIP